MGDSTRTAMSSAQPTSVPRSRRLTSRPPGLDVLSSTAVFTFGAFVRRDAVQLLSQRQSIRRSRPAKSSKETMSAESHSRQRRTALRYFVREGNSQHQGRCCLSADVSHRELRHSGIVDPNLLPSLTDCKWQSLLCRQRQCPGCAVHRLGALRPDSWRSGLFPYGHTDVKELALYARTRSPKETGLFNLGLRGDFYNGLTDTQEAEPRLGVAYNIKTNEHCSSRFLCPGDRNSVQRKSRSFQALVANLGIVRPSPVRAAYAVWTRLAQRIPCRSAASLRKICRGHRASTSGSTPTPPTISACSAIRRSFFRSGGTIRRFPGMRSA